MGRTGHAESVQVTYDPRQISYGRLLQIFFSVVHDPTELNRQGPDTGTQYRSAIFPATAEQADVAKAYIAQLDQTHAFKKPIVTKIEPDRAFYPAEDYHQDFLTRNPTYPYIAINDLPKIEDLKRLSPDVYRAAPDARRGRAFIEVAHRGGEGVSVRDVVLAALSATALLALVGPPQLRIVALAATGSGAPLQSRTPPAAPGSADDPLVLRAVVEHTILPEARRSKAGGDPAAVLLVTDRTTPLCDPASRRETACRIPDDWQQFLASNPPRGWRGLIDVDRRRGELVASLEARNAVAHALPAIDHPSIVAVPADHSEKAQQTHRAQAGGVAALSLPGYSADGHAFVYGSYWCGNLCGYTWLFLLEKSDGVWRVETAAMTSIS